jgi:hypothetical protein
MATQVCTLLLASGVSIDLKVDPPINISWGKEIQPTKDDGNVIRIADSNRCQRVWTFSCWLTKAEKDILEIYIRSATTADYPKLRIYDTAVGPNYYTEYKVYFQNPTAKLVGGRFHFTLTLPERTITVS